MEAEPEEDHSQHHASKLKGLAWLVCACALGALFAVGITPLAHVIPWKWEKTLGNALNAGLEQKECAYRPKADELLQRLVKRIYPVNSDDNNFSIDVHVVQNLEINAYGSLGGEIVIYSGFLDQAHSAEELAGVLAHEIGHVQNRHIMEGALVHMLTSEGINLVFGDANTGDWADYLLKLNFSRTQEEQADEFGLERLQQAHVNNKGFKDFFARMEDESPGSAFMSDHPTNRSRMAMVNKFDNNNTTPIMTKEEWETLRNYCSTAIKKTP